MDRAFDSTSYLRKNGRVYFSNISLINMHNACNKHVEEWRVGSVARLLFGKAEHARPSTNQRRRGRAARSSQLVD